MTQRRPRNVPSRGEADAATELDVLLQVVHEVDGLKTLEDLIPPGLLWHRPPGLPSGAELLWLVHLVDTHVFLPAADELETTVHNEIDAPDYQALLVMHPCVADGLDELSKQIRASRRMLVDRLRSIRRSVDTTGARYASLLERILTHDRRVLAALAERLYESGLGT